jgi:hypothetical protein
MLIVKITTALYQFHVRALVNIKEIGWNPIRNIGIKNTDYKAKTKIYVSF